MRFEFECRKPETGDFEESDIGLVVEADTYGRAVQTATDMAAQVYPDLAVKLKLLFIVNL